MEKILRQNNIMFHEKERKIKTILKDESNNKCFDCNNSKPEYISLNNACFICKNCFKRHQKFPLNISKTTKNNLKSLTLKELQYLYFGGNKKLLEFMKYEYPNLINLDHSYIYKTVAMEYYRNWLKFLIEGGSKPLKPEIEIAYKSIENKGIPNNNTNEDNNVITIDFYNDCYNYNDKYNHTITNFIKNKSKNKINNGHNNNTFQYKERYETQNNFYKKKNSNYNDNYNYSDYLNKYINTQTIDLMSHTQTHFMPKKNRIVNNFINGNGNKITDIQNKINININLSQNEDNKNYDNINNNKGSNTNNKIYIKPKHNILKSIEKIQKNDFNDEIIKGKENGIEVIRIKIKKKPDKNKSVELREQKADIIKEKVIDLNTNYKINKNNNRNFLSAIYSPQNKEEYNDNNYKIRTSIKKNLDKKFNYCLNDLIYNADTKRLNENENKIMQKNYENINIKNSFNDNLTSTNKYNLIFKKKNLKNSFYVNYEKKKPRNYSTVEHSEFEIISKNKTNTINTSNNESRNNEESNDDSLTLNTTRALSLNKSMKHFYSRYPRKMNKTKTKTKLRNSNNSKKKDEKENKKFKKLKKEKSEIIHSLKLLLRKKNELSKKKNEKRENSEESESSEEEDEYQRVSTLKKNKIILKKSEVKEKNKKIKEPDSESDESSEKEYKNEKIKKIYKDKNKDKNSIKKNVDNDSIGVKYKKKSYKYSEI